MVIRLKPIWRRNFTGIFLSHYRLLRRCRNGIADSISIAFQLAASGVKRWR